MVDRLVGGWSTLTGEDERQKIGVQTGMKTSLGLSWPGGGEKLTKEPVKVIGKRCGGMLFLKTISIRKGKMRFSLKVWGV